jgi:hypothetical protein
VSLGFPEKGDACGSLIRPAHATSGLPFQGEVNTGFGVLAKVYVDATISFYEGMPEGEPEQADVKAAKEQAFEVLEDTFVMVKTPKLEIERGFRFWDAVSLAFFDKKRSDKIASSSVHLCPIYSSWYRSVPSQKYKDLNPRFSTRSLAHQLSSNSRLQING